MKNKMSVKYIISLLFIVVSISSSEAMQIHPSRLTYTFDLDQNQNLDNKNTSYKRLCILDNTTTIASMRYSVSNSAAYLHDINVVSKYHDLGIGSALFISMKDHLKELHIPLIRVHAKKTKPFFKRHGMYVIKKNKEGLDLMELRLASRWVL